MTEIKPARRGKGLSRRQVIARGGAALGVAWVAPVIRTTKAYATGASDGTERPCTHFYVVSISRENRAWPMFPNGQAELPPSWRPQPCGNGWPDPWNGDGHPPWQSSAGGAGGPDRAQSRSGSGVTSSTPTSSVNQAETYTYRPPARQAGPGRSVGFAAAGAAVAPTGQAPGSGVVIDGDAKIRADHSVPDRIDDAQFGSLIGCDLPDPLPPPILDWIAANPGVKLESPKNMPVITQVGRDGWASLLPAPPHLPDWWSRRCRLILGCYKNGNEFGGDAYPDPNPRDPDQHGRRLIFPTRPERFGGYIGRAGLPGDYRDDQQWEYDDVVRNQPQRTAGPGRSVGFAEAPSTTAPTTTTTSSTLPPPEAPRTGPPPVAIPDANGQIPGVDRPRTEDEEKALEAVLVACGPDEALPYPWNLPFPLNLVATWTAALVGITYPPPPPGACVAPEMVVDPDDPDAQPPGSTSTSSSSSTSTSSSSTSSSTSTSVAPADSSTSSTSSSSSTTSTTGPVAHAAADPDDAVQPKYSHGGHFGDHECIILIFCCP